MIISTNWLLWDMLDVTQLLRLFSQYYVYNKVYNSKVTQSDSEVIMEDWEKRHVTKLTEQFVLKVAE